MKFEFYSEIYDESGFPIGSMTFSLDTMENAVKAAMGFFQEDEDAARRRIKIKR